MTKESKMEDVKKSKKKTVVVLGDWFIDENWLLARNYTYSSSHTGDFHYISMHENIDKRMINLCGAAEIEGDVRAERAQLPKKMD